MFSSSLATAAKVAAAVTAKKAQASKPPTKPAPTHTSAAAEEANAADANRTQTRKPQQAQDTNTASSTQHGTDVSDGAKGQAATARPQRPASTVRKPTPATNDAPGSDTDGQSAADAATAATPAQTAEQAAADAATTAATAAATAAADAAQAAQDPTLSGDLAAGESTAANGTARPPVRATANTNSSTTAAQTNTEDPTATEPAVDAAGSGGLSLLQLLARTLGSKEPAVPAKATDSSVPAAGKSTDSTDSADSTSDDPNALAMAMFNQALAAALGGATAVQPSSGSSAAVASQQSDASAAAVGDALQSGTQGQTQTLVTMLAQQVALDAKGKSDAAAAQPDVGATKAAGDGSDTNTNSSAQAAPGADAGAAQVGSASHFSLQHAQAAASNAELKATVGSSAWNDELGGHLTWMTQKGLETGSLRVSPEHLGPVEVHITVQNGDASVWFGANNADTRAALSQALPRLQEMFARQGMNLTDSGVSRESPRDQSRSQTRQGSGTVTAVGGIEGAAASAHVGLGLVDTYV